MLAYDEKMRQYIQTHAIDAEHLVFEHSCHSVAEAAAVASATPEEFVKSICLIAGDDSRLVVAVVKGEDKASTSRVGRVLGIDRPRLATGAEIEALTGYGFGGTPAFGFEATFLVDESVMDRAIVYTGGGSSFSLVKIRTEEMLRANQGRVCRVRK